MKKVTLFVVTFYRDSNAFIKKCIHITHNITQATMEHVDILIIGN